MNFKKMFSRDKISIYELVKHPELMEMAQFVAEGLDACTKTMSFHFGEEWIDCYHCEIFGGGYREGKLNLRGILVCRSEEDRKLASVNLHNPKAVLRALKKKDDFSRDLKYFLNEQIKKAKELEEQEKQDEQEEQDEQNED